MLCKDCRTKVTMLSHINGRCQECHLAHVGGRTPEVVEEHRELLEEHNNILMTTETAHNLPVEERLGIVTAEAVLGMNAFKDMLGDISGTLGGRSETFQKGLRDAKEICFRELRAEAHKLGANALVGVDLDYLEIGTSGRMLVLVASGTAIRTATKQQQAA